MSPRAQGPRPRTALLGSLALHALAVAAVGLASLGANPAPRQVRVYRVDIVSPAPNVPGEPPAEAPPTSDAGAAPAPRPAEPQPAAPEPPAPPAPEPPREPAPRREEPRQRPPERPRPAAPTPATERTAEAPRETRRESPKDRPPAERPGTGSAPSRSVGPGTRPAPAAGRNPDPGSPGGEGLNVRTRGVACPENYCNNVVRQVRRFFRAPEGTHGASGNVCFTLFRDGSVDEVTVERQRGGGFQFRLALIEAVEQAGNQRAFGALPAAFGAESLQLCVLMSPATT